MHPFPSAPSNTTHNDEDLREQAKPGHGIPSQDPDPAAQNPLNAQEAAREADSVMVGGGAVAGAAAGAAIGIAVGGPVGVVVGTTLGAVAGALGGAAAGAPVVPQEPSTTPTLPMQRPEALAR